MADAKKGKGEWPWSRLYAEKIVREGGLEKAASLLIDSEPELNAKPAYQMPEKEENIYLGCRK